MPTTTQLKTSRYRFRLRPELAVLPISGLPWQLFAVSKFMNEILAAIGGGLAGAKVLEKLLGPTAEYLGDEMRTLVKKRIETSHRIFEKAKTKLGDRINSPGAVPPQVLAGILNDGSYREDCVSVDYYGGVLASSRTQIPRDDRAATFVKLVSRLSTYQLRLHYIIYRLMLKLYGGLGVGVGSEQDRVTLRTFIPKSSLSVAMDFSQAEDSDAILLHAVLGLVRESLIGPPFVLGDSNELAVSRYTGKAPGLVVDPSILGVELFLYAMGSAHLPIYLFFSPHITFDSIEGVTLPADSESIRNLTMGAAIRVTTNPPETPQASPSSH